MPTVVGMRTRAQRREWLGTHPVRGAIIGAVVLAVALVVSGLPTWDHPLRGIVFAVPACGLIGVGLFFVFRSEGASGEADLTVRVAGEPIGRSGASGVTVAPARAMDRSTSRSQGRRTRRQKGTHQ